MAELNRDEVILQLLEVLQDAEISISQVDADSSEDFELARELIQQLQEELQTLLY